MSAGGMVRAPLEIGHTDYAAGLSIFGCPVAYTKVRSLASDEERTLWHVTCQPCAQHAGVDVRGVLARHRCGRLLAEEPHHMFLDALRAIEARRDLAAWRAQGGGVGLVRGHAPGRWRLSANGERVPPGGAVVS